MPRDPLAMLFPSLMPQTFYLQPLIDHAKQLRAQSLKLQAQADRIKHKPWMKEQYERLMDEAVDCERTAAQILASILTDLPEQGSC